MLKEKILVVDDEDNIRGMIADTLSVKGFTVFQASDIDGALKLVTQERPDLILLDLKLGRASGIDVLQKVKEIDKNISVIIITAYGSPETDIKEIKFGAYGEISKPFDINILEKVVLDALGANQNRRKS